MYRNEWMAFFTWMKSPSESLSESLSDRVRSITSHLTILQHPKLTDWRAVAPEPANWTANESIVPITVCAFTMCACMFILFSAHLASYFRSAFLRSGFHSCPTKRLCDWQMLHVRLLVTCACTPPPTCACLCVYSLSPFFVFWQFLFLCVGALLSDLQSDLE